MFLSVETSQMTYWFQKLVETCSLKNISEVDEFNRATLIIAITIKRLGTWDILKVIWFTIKLGNFLDKKVSP